MDRSVCGILHMSKCSTRREAVMQTMRRHVPFNHYLYLAVGINTPTIILVCSRLSRGPLNAASDPWSFVVKQLCQGVSAWFELFFLIWLSIRLWRTGVRWLQSFSRPVASMLLAPAFAATCILVIHVPDRMAEMLLPEDSLLPVIPTTLLGCSLKAWETQYALVLVPSRDPEKCVN